MIFSPPHRKNKDAASRRLHLMSFERHEEIYPNNRGADPKADAPAHRLDEFPAGYSLTGCSPALPASASPARVDYAFSSAQLRGFSVTREVDKPKQHDSGGSTLMDQFFCPKNRVHLRGQHHQVGSRFIFSHKRTGQRIRVLRG